MQGGGGPVVRDARQGPEREALLERVLWAGVEEREGLQAHGRRPQRKDHQECESVFSVMSVNINLSTGF